MDEMTSSRWSASTGAPSIRGYLNTTPGQRHLQLPASSVKPKKAPWHRRLAQSLKLKAAESKAKWKAFQNPSVGLHLTQDPDPDSNATHQRLPEEHTQAWKHDLEVKEQEHLISKHRIFRGPVPRQRKSFQDNDPRFNIDKPVEELKKELELHFLAPVEKEILFLLRRTRRSSRFRPLLEPQNELLLVHQNDIDAITKVQELVRELPEGEKHTLCQDLHRFLPAHHMYVLRLVLFNPEIQITTHTRGSGVESPPAANATRPETELFFKHVLELNKQDPKKIRWDQPIKPSPHEPAATRANTGDGKAPELKLRGLK